MRKITFTFDDWHDKLAPLRDKETNSDISNESENNWLRTYGLEPDGDLNCNLAVFDEEKFLKLLLKI